MIEKLYEQGYLNYQSLVLSNYKKLGINEIEAVILIKMLDLYKTNKKIRVNKLTQETGIPKRVVEECLNNLITNNIYGVDVVVNDQGLNEERVSFSCFFLKIETLFKENEVIESENELKTIIEMYEGEMNRPMTPQEYILFEDLLIKDGFLVTDIKQAILEAVKMNRLSINQIEKILITNRKNNFQTNRPVIDENKKKVLDKLFSKL